MSKSLEQLLQSFASAQELSELIELAGVQDDPLFSSLLFPVAASGASGSHKSQAMLRKALTGRAIARQLIPPQRAWPQVRQENLVALGREPESGRTVFIDYEHLPMKIIAIGASGCGKTTLAAFLVGQLLPRLRTVVSDSKREGFRIGRLCGRSFLYAKPNRIYENDLEPVGRDPDLYATGLVEDLGYLLGIDRRTAPALAGVLGDVRRHLNADEPMISLSQFVRVLDRIAQCEGKPAFATAASKVQTLCSAYGKRACVRRGPDVLNRYRLLCIDFSGASHQVRAVCQALWLRRIMQSVSTRGHDASPKLLVVTDEALDDGSKQVSQKEGQITYQERLSAQARSFGICQMSLYQDPGQIPASAIANTANLIVMRQPHYDHARRAAKLLLLPDDAVPVIQSLPVGHGFLRSPHFPEAVRFVVPKIDLGPYPSSAEIESAMAGEYAWMEANTEFSPEEAAKTQTRDYGEILGGVRKQHPCGGAGHEEQQSPASAAPAGTSAAPSSPRLLNDWVLLLTDIRSNPDFSVVQHYASVGFSRAKGNRVKTELLERDMIAVKEVRTGRGRPRKILTLTELGKNALEALAS